MLKDEGKVVSSQRLSLLQETIGGSDEFVLIGDQEKMYSGCLKVK